MLALYPDSRPTVSFLIMSLKLYECKYFNFLKAEVVTAHIEIGKNKNTAKYSKLIAKLVSILYSALTAKEITAKATQSLML